jgi:hypothetical protein
VRPDRRDHCAWLNGAEEAAPGQPEPDLAGISLRPHGHDVIHGLNGAISRSPAGCTGSLWDEMAPARRNAFTLNIGSWRVLEKAGMRYAGTASYHRADDLRKYVARHDLWGPAAKRGAL